MTNRLMFCFVAALLMLGTSSAAAQTNQGTRIGVANVTRIFEQLDERTHVEQEIRADAQQLSERQNQYRQRISNLQAQLEVIERDSPEFLTTQEELNETLMQMQVWGEMQQQRLARREAIESFRLYRKMLDTIAAVAQDEGLDIVLFQDEVPQNFQNMQDLRAQIQMRQVLYASDNVRISDQVVQRMNTEFQAGQ